MRAKNFRNPFSIFGYLLERNLLSKSGDFGPNLGKFSQEKTNSQSPGYFRCFPGIWIRSPPPSLSPFRVSRFLRGPYTRFSKLLPGSYPGYWGATTVLNYWKHQYPGVRSGTAVLEKLQKGKTPVQKGGGQKSGSLTVISHKPASLWDS
jgi:hypothetical protein